MSPTLNQKQPLINRHLQIKFSFLQGSLKLLLPSYCLPNTRGTTKADSISSIKLPCLIILCQSFSLKRTFYFIFNFNILIYIFFISLFTLQVFCIYIITSSLLCLWDSWVCEWVGVWIYISWLYFFLDSFHSLFGPIPKYLIYLILFYYYTLEGWLFSNERRKRVVLNGRGCGEYLEKIEGGKTLAYIMLEKLVSIK